MPKKSPFSVAELRFLKELQAKKIPFMVVGLSGAVFQGAPLVTQDVDLWFKDFSDPLIAEAIKKAGGAYVPPFIEMQTPPRFVGKDFLLLDIVTGMAGLDEFEEEYKRAKTIKVGELKLKVLPLDRIIHSKKTAGRQKDKAVLPALEAVLATLNRNK